MTQELVLLDANTWVKEHMFRSGIGAALLFSIKAKKYKLLVPDTLRAEVSARVGEVAAKAVSSAKSNLAAIRAITGSAPEPRLPQVSDIERNIDDRWSELKSLIHPHPVTEEIMRRALRRVIDHRAPGGEKEQFRDALLWEVALECAQVTDVHLVSEDKDFGANGQLVPTLAHEVEDAKARLTFHSRADGLLELIVPREPISVPAVTQAVLTELGWRLAELRAGPVFEIGAVVRSEPKAYATEDPGRVAVTFEVALAASRRDEAIAGELVARGECASDTKTGAVFDVRVDDIVFKTATAESRVVLFLSNEVSYRNGLKPFTVRREISGPKGE